MGIARFFTVLLIGCLIFQLQSSLANGASQTQPQPRMPLAPPPVKDIPEQYESPEPDEKEPTDVVEATIINPYRSANIGSDTSGIIDFVNFEEGDAVKQGRVMAEISKKRHILIAEKAKEAVRGMEFALTRGEQQVVLMKQLLDKGATTQQELLKAQTERDAAETRLAQAVKEYDLAKLNLDACVVKAPFAGYVAVKYKQAFEPVERLEKIFAIIDTRKVYAIANVSENLSDKFQLHEPTVFTESSGKRYFGVVDRVGKVIDVKSKTRKVFVLIDNPTGELVVGMTGSLRPGKSESK